MVVALRGKESQCKRLEDLGILPGTEVEILANNGGPVLLAVGESRIALESDVAACVLVV